jgi:hypothetical protein
MPVDWQPIECAPKDGSTIEAMSRDWGKRKSTTLYRARWFAGHWRNAEDPREELHYLYQWREAPARSGLAEMLDRLPIACLAVHERHGKVIELLHSIAAARAAGDEAKANQAILHVAEAVTAAKTMQSEVQKRRNAAR